MEKITHDVTFKVTLTEKELLNVQHIIAEGGGYLVLARAQVGWVVLHTVPPHVANRTRPPFEPEAGDSGSIDDWLRWGKVKGADL